MRFWGVLAALAATTGVVACSAPDAGPAENTPTSVVPSVGHGSLAYCLGQHGMPAPPGPASGPPAGVDPRAWHEAMAACSSLAPGPTAG